MPVAPDASTISVVNLPPTEPQAPTPAPAKPSFDILKDKLSTLVADEPHPLHAAEPEPEPEPSPEPEPTPEPQVTPEIKGHPKDLLDAARNLGIDERHLVPGVVPTQVLLDFVVRERLKDATLAAKQIQPMVTPPAPKVDEDLEVIDYLEKEVGADPKLTSLLRKQHEEIKQLKSRPPVDQVVKQAMARRDAVAAVDRTLDAAFAAIGHGMYGKGRMEDLDSQEERQARIDTVGLAQVDLAKDPPQVIRQKILAAHERLTRLTAKLGGKPAEAKPAASAYAAAPAQNAPSQNPPNGTNGNGHKPPLTQQEWDDASLGRPNGKAKSKQELAHREVLHDFYRDNGIDFDGKQEEFDGIPG